MTSLSIRAVKSEDKTVGFYISSLETDLPGLLEIAVPMFDIGADDEIEVTLLLVAKSLVNHLLVNGVLINDEQTKQFLETIFTQDVDPDFDFTLNVEKDVVIFIESLLRPSAAESQDENLVLGLTVFQEEEDDIQPIGPEQKSATSEAGQETDSFIPERGEIQIDLSLLTEIKEEKPTTRKAKTKSAPVGRRNASVNRNESKSVSTKVDYNDLPLDQLQSIAVEKGAKPNLVKVMSRFRLLEFIGKS